MRYLLTVFVLIFFFISCKKETIVTQPDGVPAMAHKNLLDSAVTFGKHASYDLDGDGMKDIYFTTLYVGDAVFQVDKKQWLVSSSFYANLPVNNNEEIPRMIYGDSIPVNNFSGYSWYNASTVILGQKIISNTAPPYWVGQYLNASHNYIPLQILKGNNVFAGWVDVSFDSVNERIILHKAAISLEPGKTIKAGM